MIVFVDWARGLINSVNKKRKIAGVYRASTKFKGSVLTRAVAARSARVSAVGALPSLKILGNDLVSAIDSISEASPDFSVMTISRLGGRIGAIDTDWTRTVQSGEPYHVVGVLLEPKSPALVVSAIGRRFQHVDPLVIGLLGEPVKFSNWYRAVGEYLSSSHQLLETKPLANSSHLFIFAQVFWNKLDLEELFPICELSGLYGPKRPSIYKPKPVSRPGEPSPKGGDTKPEGGQK